MNETSLYHPAGLATGSPLPVAAVLPAIPEARWAETTPLEAVRGFLPTMGDCFIFVTAAHENMHLGQLSAWRRVQGMGRV